MNLGKTLFAQLMEFVPWTSFARIVERYGGDSGVRVLSCTEHFRAMAFAQLTYRESLRDIAICLQANQKKLYGMGFRTPVKRSTLAGANEGRDWHIWEDLAMVLRDWPAHSSTGSGCAWSGENEGWICRWLGLESAE